MEEDVTKIYEEYSEELLFCKYFIAEKLKHHKQVFFLKDGQDRQFYVLDNHFPIMQNFSRLIQSLQN